jgi:hypothetical protein
MSGWSRTLSRRAEPVLRVDIETCPACGGAVRIVACIEEDQVVIQLTVETSRTVR